MPRPARRSRRSTSTARAPRASPRRCVRGAPAVAFACDIADEAACHAAVASAQSALGGIDILVNNAGISARLLLRDATPEIARRVMAVNYFGALHATHAALRSSSAAGRSSSSRKRRRLRAAGRPHGLRGEQARAAWLLRLSARRNARHGRGRDDRLPSFIATGIEGRGAGRGAARDRRRRSHARGDRRADRRCGAARRAAVPAGTHGEARLVAEPRAPASYERAMLRRVGAEFGISTGSEPR